MTSASGMNIAALAEVLALEQDGVDVSLGFGGIVVEKRVRMVCRHEREGKVRQWRDPQHGSAAPLVGAE